MIFIKYIFCSKESLPYIQIYLISDYPISDPSCMSKTARQDQHVHVTLKGSVRHIAMMGYRRSRTASVLVETDVRPLKYLITSWCDCSTNKVMHICVIIILRAKYILSLPQFPNDIVSWTDIQDRMTAGI